jgi:hypothetical protein
VNERGESAVEHDFRERSKAARELAAALRELTDAAVSAEVDADTLRSAAQRAREIVPPLRAHSRTRNELPSLDIGPGRTYNPAEGPGNPIAPPMRVDIVDGLALGRCTLGLAYEGPPGYVHGGVSALLLDQILGHANVVHGLSGLTVTLSVRYRRPVPLQTPLLVTGELVDANRPRRILSKATIATADHPDTILVECEGAFVVPRQDQVESLFGEVRQASQAVPE